MSLPSMASIPALNALQILFGSRALAVAACALAHGDVPVKLLLHQIPMHLPGHHVTLQCRSVTLGLAVQAAGAIQRYGVHVVVANILETRKDVVTLVSLAAAGPSAPLAESVIRRQADEKVIEAPLVAELVKLHSAYQGLARDP